jgi:hypothetical protein
VEELSEREWCWEKVVILGQRLYCICSVVLRENGTNGEGGNERRLQHLRTSI